MKSKIVSELKNGLEFPHSRGEVAAQEQRTTLGQAMTSSKGGPQIPKRSMISSSYSNETKKGQIFWLLGDTFTGGETDGKYPVSEISSPPRGGPPLHSHTKESE